MHENTAKTNSKAQSKRVELPLPVKPSKNVTLAMIIETFEM
jgi:hypothetical protein